MARADARTPLPLAFHARAVRSKQIATPNVRIAEGAFPWDHPFQAWAYIEVSHLWEDFHSKLIGEMQRVLSARVPDRYVVRTGERSYVAVADEGLLTVKQK